MAPVTDKTIAFITTGGTIGAALGGDVVTLGDNVGAQNVRNFVDSFIASNNIDVRTFAPLNKFSEDFTPSDWGIVLDQIKACVDLGIRRIVVAHGTDTLVYSTFAASLYWSGKPVRVCFTAAFMPPSEPASDAFMNIECALQAVRNDHLPTGVYVSFRNSFFEVDVYRAQDLKAIGSDETSFGSVYGRRAARFAYDSIVGVSAAGEIIEITSIAAPLLQVVGDAPTAAQLASPTLQVVQVPASPGMTLARLALDQNADTLVILENYHSGTLPAVTLRAELEALRESHPRAVVVSAPHPYRYIKLPYETTAALERGGLLRVYKDLLPHQLYVLALCEAARGKSLADTLALIEPWRFTVPQARA